MKRGILTAIALFLLATVLACSTAGDQANQPQGSESAASVQEANGPSEGVSPRLDEVELITGPKSEDGYQAIFATPDLGVGENRVAVVVTSPNGLVRSPGATFSTLFFPSGDSEGERKETKLAVFKEFPLGTRGLYSARMNFDQPGRWSLEVTVLDDSAAGHQVEVSFEVMDAPATPAIGQTAIASRNKTLKDVEDISELTTGSMYDEDLYQTTIADAVGTGLPTVIVMASPAFCTNAVCGPQVDVLSELKNAYKGQANFIHIDIYDNPNEIQGDLNNGVISPTVIEWNLPSTEWSFVIDRNGKIAERFEAFAGYDELEDALKSVL